MFAGAARTGRDLYACACFPVIARGAASAFIIGALVGLTVGPLVGALLFPPNQPLDRPAPRLAAYATCQVP